MAETFDAVQTLAAVLVEHGPLHEEDIVRRLRERGVPDPETVWENVLEEENCSAGYLTDGRWIWLPAVLAGRVFSHRVSADELAHDVLAVTPDLEPITRLCDHGKYQRLADGSPVQVVIAEFDDELLEERGVSPEVVDPDGALLFAPGTLQSLGVDAGDVVGVRLTDEGLVVERVTELGDDYPVADRLAAMVDEGGPVDLDEAVWTACVDDPALFTQPSAPLSEIVDDAGLARRRHQLAPGGFDFDRWFFDRRSAGLADRHDLEADDAVALASLIALFDQISTILETAAEVDELPDDVLAEAAERAAQDEPDELAAVVGQLGAALAEPLLAELLVAETLDRRRGGAAALGLFAEVLEPKVPRAARVACRWLRAVALERVGNISEAERELLAAESMDPDWPLPLFDLARIASDRGDVERGLSPLHRAGAEPDDPLVGLLERHRVRPPAEA